MSVRRGAVLAAALALALAAGLMACDGGDDPESDEGPAIVSIGDSVASGEGNPAAKRPRWIDRRCHRAAIAGQTLAGEEAVRARPELRFVSFACSGATIERGLLGPYKGIEPALLRRPAPPQVHEVAALSRASDGGIAAVLLSIGGNDIGFLKIVVFCASVRRCPARHFNPRFPFLEGGDKRPTLEETVRSRLDELDDRYRRLDAALEPLVDSERVVVVEYFDPTTAPDGSDCNAKVLRDGIRPDESRWARENVIAPLNAAIETAAAEHGWRLVDGVAERFRGHGVCAKGKRWVRVLGERPLTGTLHPNEAGHRQIAALIAPVLAEALNP
jgi:lysophospholipase L1-like esterase